MDIETDEAPRTTRRPERVPNSHDEAFWGEKGASRFKNGLREQSKDAGFGVYVSEGVGLELGLHSLNFPLGQARKEGSPVWSSKGENPTPPPPL